MSAVLGEPATFATATVTVTNSLRFNQVLLQVRAFCIVLYMIFWVEWPGYTNLKARWPYINTNIIDSDDQVKCPSLGIIYAIQLVFVSTEAQQVDMFVHAISNAM